MFINTQIPVAQNGCGDVNCTAANCQCKAGECKC
uniref:Metallothionein 1 n=1 Tax=Cystoderma carcharias TaxID=511157 RepID=A0A7U3V9J3_9AGAR|nr:metallothionein 1 [Cystoderma carcharias]